MDSGRSESDTSLARRSSGIATANVLYDFMMLVQHDDTARLDFAGLGKLKRPKDLGSRSSQPKDQTMQMVLG